MIVVLEPGGSARILPHMSITATVENDMIKLPAGVHVPDGTKVEIMLPAQKFAEQIPATLYDSLKDFIGAAQGLPEDFAAEHDHYLHGMPRRAAR